MLNFPKLPLVVMKLKGVGGAEYAVVVMMPLALLPVSFELLIATLAAFFASMPAPRPPLFVLPEISLSEIALAAVL